jgi:hypothetical protein
MGLLKPKRLVYFEFTHPQYGQPVTEGEEWLQITSISNIGDIGQPIKQKIIRLDGEDQLQLYELLKTKFERGGIDLR